MATFQISPGTIRPLSQTITVNGAACSILECSGITLGSGACTTRAEFSLPGLLFDQAGAWLNDAKVCVWISNASDGSAPDAPDFVGYLDTKSADVSPDDDKVHMTAKTITAYLSRVHVGQTDNRSGITYQLVDAIGRKTNWTPEKILRDLWGRLPSFYAAEVGLGLTSALSGLAPSNTPELCFRLTTYQDALQQILALFGDMTFRERFEASGKVLLDFYRINDPGAPSLTLRLGQWDDPIANGTTIQSLSLGTQAQEAVTRVIGFGTAKRYIITVTNYDPAPAKQLVKGWDAALEAAVLADPEIAKPGAPGHVPGMELVFTRWYLPACLAATRRLKDLPVVNAKGARYAPQCYKLPTLAAPDENGTYVGVELTEGEPIKSVRFDLEKGFFQLQDARAGLNLAGFTSDPTSQKLVYTWAPAKLGITFCVEGEDEILGDTGQDFSSGLGFPFGRDGLTDSWKRDDLTFIQWTNQGHPIAGQSFGAYFFDEDARTWYNRTTAVIARDDTAQLNAVCHELLKASQKRHKAYTVQMNRFARGYPIGARLYITGQADFDHDCYCITGVTYGLEGQDQSTEITADNVRPPRRETLIKRETRSRTDNRGGSEGEYLG